jgi:hypothetical protein
VSSWCLLRNRSSVRDRLAIVIGGFSYSASILGPGQTTGCEAERAHSRASASAHGFPGLLKAAKQFEAELIVMGARSLGTVERLVLGSVSTKVMHESGSDVLIVK